MSGRLPPPPPPRLLLLLLLMLLLLPGRMTGTRWVLWVSLLAAGWM